MNYCTFDLIPKNVTLACEYVQKNCSASYIHFYSMNYCLFNDRLYITIPILLIFLIISFFLLSDTSNRYLSSALTILSDKLKMSQNLAGVTLLALGNGAPDVISGIVASDESGGVQFTVASLFGGGVFVTCIVFSSVVLLSDKVQLTRQLFVRDVLLYIMAVTILLIFSYVGKINIFMACGFFALYLM
jgi:solute carrier family 24 (sodium/potassium/calcium exchanger), member 6